MDFGHAVLFSANIVTFAAAEPSFPEPNDPRAELARRAHDFWTRRERRSLPAFGAHSYISDMWNKRRSGAVGAVSGRCQSDKRVPGTGTRVRAGSRGSPGGAPRRSTPLQVYSSRRSVGGRDQYRLDPSRRIFGVMKIKSSFLLLTSVVVLKRFPSTGMSPR